MTETPYLIAHLVRGVPAFDIATRCDDMGTKSDPGPWWIIPTSGHRAYPYEQWLLSDIANITLPIEAPPDWPDHYAPSHAPRGTGLITNLADLLGFVSKPPTITRR